MGYHDIDTGRLIDEVRSRKCLWDASDPLYRNKDARNKAWDDIVVALFENVSSEEIQHLGKSIQQRWKTVRDAFFRSKAVMKNTPSENSQNTESSADNNISASINNDAMPSSSNVSQDVQGQTSTASSENPWDKKRKNRPRQSSQESFEFEKGLLNLLASLTADIASDDLSFFFLLRTNFKNL
ncbi:unnamed protein product [Parnassius apollo]|uniref:(apollo) hypothetical protein n=1 Tax=Parnassius apollo TaxID=110799 RepID=A0A8S3X1J9_PARAO|nr:unnamed protein product [Parnassius apollo]